MRGGRAFRRTTTGDLFDPGASDRHAGTLLGARLTAGGGAATAQLQDANGTVLADLAAPANSSDRVRTPITFEGKVTLAAVSGSPTSVMVFVW